MDGTAAATLFCLKNGQTQGSEDSQAHRIL